MNFFIDANISRYIANMLAALTEDMHNIVHITAHEDFIINNTYSKNGKIIGNNTRDLAYIARLRDSGLDWKIISGDADIVDTAHERAALIESGLTFFCVDHHWSRAKAPEQAWKIVKLWEEIVVHAARPGQSIYRLCMGRRLCVELIQGDMRMRGGKFKG